MEEPKSEKEKYNHELSLDYRGASCGKTSTFETNEFMLRQTAVRNGTKI